MYALSQSLHYPPMPGSRSLALLTTLIACSLLAGCAAPSIEDSTSGISSQSGDVFVHEPSGLKFPKQIGAFERGTVSSEAAMQPAASVGYRATKSLYGRMSLFLNTTVRVAPAGGMSPEAVLRMHQASFAGAHADAKLEDAASGVNGFTYFTYRRPGWNDLAGLETHVIRHGDHLALCSITFLSVRRDDWRASIDQFVRTLAAQ